MSSSLPEIPSTIGPYVVECLLKKGGMSILYLASHPETKEPTTIKVLLPKHLSSPDVTKQFLKEAEIISLADHPNIIKLYGYGEWEGGLYIAMEFIQGLSLRQYILSTPISLRRAIEIILDVAYALCHLHTHGVIHRDLKPENILLTEREEIKVIDFGIAALLSEAKDAQKNRFIGTPVYMSPEQRENPSNVSFPSDIYSLGIIAYEILLGRLSHGHVHLSLLPKGMQKIIQKTLQQDPKDRYRDVVDFITDVSGYLHSNLFEQDKKGHDKLSDFARHLKRTKDLFTPSMPVHLPFVSIGGGTISSTHIANSLLFFNKQNSTSFVCFIEPAKGQKEAFLHLATLRGMLMSLEKTKSREILHAFQNILKKDPFNFAFSALFLFFNDTNMEYGHFGNIPLLLEQEGYLMQIEPTLPLFNKDISLENVLTPLPWTGSIRIFFHSSTDLFSEELVKSILENLKDAKSAEKQGDAVLRKVKISTFPSEWNHTFSFYCIHKPHDA